MGVFHPTSLHTWLVQFAHSALIAKSSWSDPLLEDIDRPLNKRGENAARFMAGQIAATGCRFEHIYCSPAQRAVTTLEIIADQLSDRDIHWQIDNSLYTFDHYDLIDWLTRVDDSIAELLIVGHNPALTRLSNAIGSSPVTNIPTCGFIRLVSAGQCNWRQIENCHFETTAILKPKLLMKSAQG